MAEILDGARVAARMKMELADRVARLRAQGRAVGLGTILVGDDPASATYVGLKHADCAEMGIESIGIHLSADATQAQIIEAIDEMNANPAVHSFLVQLPLPEGVDTEQVLLRIDPAKDVDGLHPVNLGKLLLGAPGPVPCTPAGIVELLAAHRVPVEGRHVVIIGRGITVGRPLSVLLASRRAGCNAAVTVVHSDVDNLADIVRQADVIISAAGSPGLVTPNMVKPGAAVVGAGTSWSGKKLLSDIDPEVENVAQWLTPRLGGVGPMTRAMLIANVVRAAEKSD
jgi:methylenetetrahydrofolate dehydrogenase (NADP+)/methenyltetrahydrofolate cyclohydrolase